MQTLYSVYLFILTTLCRASVKILQFCSWIQSKVKVVWLTSNTSPRSLELILAPFNKCSNGLESLSHFSKVT